MMSRFLLLFCFATLHVLGEQVSSKSNDHRSVLSQQSVPIQNLEANSPSDKIIQSVQSVSVPLKEDENKTKPEESSSTVQTSTNIPIDSTTVSEAIDVTKHKPITTTTTTITTTTTATSTTIKPPPTPAPSPNTTTTPDIITTPSTPVVPPGTPGKWVVNGTNITCIVLQMAVTFNVSYEVNHTAHFKLFDMPIDNATTEAKGSCGGLEQELTLRWSTKNLTLTDGALTLHFMKNESTKQYSLHHLEAILPATDFPNGTISGSMILVHNESNFVVGLSNSYRCLKQQKLNLKRNDTNESAGYITVSGLQFQAFKGDSSTVFGLAKDCAFDTPDAVPIAVGCALAGLVIIVFIAYIIGHRRNQSNGYLSM